jgi:signal recognition particle receptor subunit beta
MVQINFAEKLIGVRIVLEGPAGAGKTATLESLRATVPGDHDPIESIATEGDRTLYCRMRPEGFRFDPGPPPPAPAPATPGAQRPEPGPKPDSKPACSVSTGKIAGMDIVFEVTTVPGETYYNATRKLTLQGVDGVVFVADSAPDRLEEHVAAFTQFVANMRDQGLDPKFQPLVMQWNKRDLPDALPVAELERALNLYEAPSFETCAHTADGVTDVFARIGGEILSRLTREYCSCAFDPERVARYADFTFEANLATGVTHAVLAGESRPR